MTIRRRYGTSPTQRGSATGATCPDILQLDNGDYLIIGRTPGTPHIPARELAQHGAGIGPGEQAVVVPAGVLRAAALQIAEEVLAAPGPD